MQQGDAEYREYQAVPQQGEDGPHLGSLEEGIYPPSRVERYPPSRVERYPPSRVERYPPGRVGRFRKNKNSSKKELSTTLSKKLKLL